LILIESLLLLLDLNQRPSD